MRCTPTIHDLIVLTLPPRHRCPLDRMPASRLLLPRSGLERSDFVLWHIASFRCAAEFGRYRGIADIDRAAPIKLDCPGRTGGACSSLIVPAIATSCRTTLEL